MFFLSFSYFLKAQLKHLGSSMAFLQDTTRFCTPLCPCCCHVYISVRVVYVCGIYVGAFTHVHTQIGQRRAQHVLAYHVLPSSLKTGSLMKTTSRLEGSKSHPPAVMLSVPQHLSAQPLPKCQVTDICSHAWLFTCTLGIQAQAFIHTNVISECHIHCAMSPASLYSLYVFHSTQDSMYSHDLLSMGHGAWNLLEPIYYLPHAQHGEWLIEVHTVK